MDDVCILVRRASEIVWKAKSSDNFSFHFIFTFFLQTALFWESLSYT